MKSFFTALILSVFLPTVSSKANVEAFKLDAFNKAEKDKKLVYVHVFNPKCSVCAEQKPIFDEIAAKNKENVYMRADLEDKDLKKLPKAVDGKSFYERHMTIGAFKNDQNIAVITGVTDRKELEEFLTNPKKLEEKIEKKMRENMKKTEKNIEKMQKEIEKEIDESFKSANIQ